MKHGWLTNVLLLLVVAALASFLALNPRSEPTAHRLSTLTPKDAKVIRLERTGDRAIVLERREDGWFITAPVSARADGFQVERLLAIREARTAYRLPAQDLARFELERPFASVTIDGETFAYGALNPVTREQYVLAGGAVYALPARYASVLPASVSQLIRKQLFDVNEFPVRFELAGFMVAHEDGAWRVRPSGGEQSQDDIQRWIENWRYAAALRVEPYAAEKAAGTIRVELRDGTKLTLEVIQNSPEFIIGRSDRKLRYHFVADAAKRLLAPPGTPH